METTLESKSMSIREWYDTLGTLEKREFRDELILVSGMQPPTFYSKLKRGNYSPLEMDAIKKIVGNNIEIVFPFTKSPKLLHTANHHL